MWWQLVAIMEVAEDKQVPDVVRPPFDVGLSMGTRQGRSRKYTTVPRVERASRSQGSREIGPHGGNGSKNHRPWMLPDH